VNPCKPHLWRRAPVYINYHLKSKLAITLCCQLCLTCYQLVQIEKYLYNPNSQYEKYPLQKGSHHVQPPNQHFLLSAKIDGTQMSTLVECIVHTAVCQKACTSRGEGTLNSEKLKRVALAIVKL